MLPFYVLLVICSARLWPRVKCGVRLPFDLHESGRGHRFFLASRISRFKLSCPHWLLDFSPGLISLPFCVLAARKKIQLLSLPFRTPVQISSFADFHSPQTRLVPVFDCCSSADRSSVRTLITAQHQSSFFRSRFCHRSCCDSRFDTRFRL
jgi:hypothetical protein